MHKLCLAATLAAVVAIPSVASATVYDLHVGGMCSTQFVGGKGGGYLGNWSRYGEVSIDVYIDQQNNMSTPTTQLAGYLDTYCTGGNWCYLYTYSNGGAVISRTLALYDTSWNIGYVISAAGCQGGSEIGGTGWIGEIFGGCTLAGHIGPGDHRPGWNHHDTNGKTIYEIGGNGWLAPYAQHAVLPGHDDGAVAHHSSGGFVDTWSLDSLCYSGRWTNHVIAWSCEYGDLNHYDLKMRGICNDGGC